MIQQCEPGREDWEAVRTATTRREAILWASRMAGAAALATFSGARWAELAAAQDGSVTLTAAASEVSAEPGAAYARSAAGEAVAAQGAARAAAAAALAESSSDGAIAQGAAAASAAEPDQGALARSASAVISASNQSNDEAGSGKGHAAARFGPPSYSSGGGGGRSGRAGGRRIRAAGVGGGGSGRRRQRDRVDRLPATGAGLTRFAPVSALLGIASAAAALGAVVLRRQGVEMTLAPITEHTVD